MGKLQVTRRKLEPSTRQKLTTPTKAAAPFYTSVPWLALMKEIKAERENRCHDPDHDKSKPASGVRLFGDHITELKDGGAPLDKSNIRLVCGACHTRKTAQARVARLHGRPT